MEKKDEQLTIIGKTASKEQWKQATSETVEQWVRWVVRLTIWSLWATSFYAYYFQNNPDRALLYIILSSCIGISNKIYNLEKKITDVKIDKTQQSLIVQKTNKNKVI